MLDQNLIYIAGYGRSGSTLLDWLLGQSTDICSLGEIINIWDRGWMEDQLCGCGYSFSRCDFWKQVSKSLSTQPEAVLSLRKKSARMRHWPVISGRLPRFPRYQRNLKRYHYELEKLYTAIGEVAKTRYLLDSSKDPVYALNLTEIFGQRLKIIHIVRDSRAVAYSWSRRKIRDEITSRTAFMPRYSLFKSSRDWAIFNALTRVLKNRGTDYYMVRYEDLTLRPQQTLRQLSAWLDISDCFVDQVLVDKTFSPKKTTHIVAGNPVRFVRDPIPVSPDNEWRVKMGFLDKVTVTILTAPLLKRYGYRILD